MPEQTNNVMVYAGINAAWDFLKEYEKLGAPLIRLHRS